MKLEIHRYKLLLLALICCAGVQSQNLNIIEKNGAQTLIPISSIRSLSFPSGTLNVKLHAGIPVNKALNNISVISFITITDVSNPMYVKNNTLRLFPNPTCDYINIDYQNDEKRNINVKVISVDGRILYNEVLKDQQVYPHKINVSSWESGLYFVVLNNGTSLVSGKIIKN